MNTLTGHAFIMYVNFFACCSVFCRWFAGVLQVFFAVSRPTILKPQSQCTLPARTGGHPGHSPPPVQTFIPLCSPVSLPVASGCLDRGPPGPLNAPCPGFAPYLTPHIAPSTHPGQGATWATQNPLSKHPAPSTRPLAQQWKLKAHDWSEGGSCPLGGWDSRCPYTPKGTFVLCWGKSLP